MIIFDLDGTLADITHRLHFVKDGNKDWDGFFAACSGDEPIYVLCNLYNTLAYQRPDIQVWSGRSDAVRAETSAWFRRHGLLLPQRLRMRPAGDHQPDEKLKEGWLLEVGASTVSLVFDDRQRVVDMWRRHGIRCAQVAPGDF